VEISRHSWYSRRLQITCWWQLD